MTKDTKFAHISDSASRGKGESMARESRERAEEWIAEQAIYETPCPARRGQMIENYRLTDLLTAYAASECSRLASRVEELEKLIAKRSSAPEHSPTQLDTTTEKI